MFMMAPTILRPLSVLSAILKPQDVFAILAQPANAMQAAINALPFSPDLLIGKDRVAVGDWAYRDSLRGLNLTLASNTTAAEAAWPGYSGTNNRIEYAFKQTPGVIWRVTWTGDGTSNRQIPHGLGVVPGMEIIKRRDAAGSWIVFHTSLPASGDYLILNATNAKSNSANFVTSNTSTNISIPETLNGLGATYAAILFAHDPSADGIVQCGGSIANSGGDWTVPHGWANGAQYLMYKRTDAAGDWKIVDTTRTPAFSGGDAILFPNTSGAEIAQGIIAQTNGVITVSDGGANWSYITLAIRAPY